jgi:hypothetical protein
MRARIAVLIFLARLKNEKTDEQLPARILTTYYFRLEDTKISDLVESGTDSTAVPSVCADLCVEARGTGAHLRSSQVERHRYIRYSCL